MLSFSCYIIPSAITVTKSNKIVRIHSVRNSWILSPVECQRLSMSIICTEAENSQYFNKDHQKGVSGCVWATIDPSTTHQLPFPRDYKYFSCLLNRRYALWADRIQMFKVRPDDIWTLGFGKTGKTFLHNTVANWFEFGFNLEKYWVSNLLINRINSYA